MPARFVGAAVLLAALAAGAARAQPAAPGGAPSLDAVAARPAAAATLPSGFYLENVSGPVAFVLPVAAAFAPDGRLFVVEKQGVVWVVRDGERQLVPFLDLRAEVLNSHDRGMLGIALDPHFAENGRVYVAYTVDHDGSGDRLRTDVFASVTRYAASATPPRGACCSARRSPPASRRATTPTPRPPSPSAPTARCSWGRATGRTSW
jgi:glucose/arabinose dehydrogenase